MNTRIIPLSHNDTNKSLFSKNCNLQRLKLLLQRQFNLDAKTWLTGIASLASILFFFSIIRLLFEKNNAWIETIEQFGVGIVLIAGFVFTSRGFANVNNKVKSMQYLILPASIFEKFFTIWLITSVCYMLTSTFMLITVSFLISIIGTLFFNLEFIVFNPFTNNYGTALLVYILFHSLFFLGAIYFKKHHFFKTILSMFAINMLLSIWFVFLTYILFNTDGNFSFDYFHFSNTIFVDTFETVMKRSLLIFWSVMSVYLYIVAYFRLTEKEV